MSADGQQSLKKYFPITPAPNISQSNSRNDNNSKRVPEQKVLSKMMTFCQNRIKEPTSASDKVEKNNTHAPTFSAPIDLTLESAPAKRKIRPQILENKPVKDITKQYSKSKCFFCQKAPAVILITGKLMGSQPKPLCLLHYYTTRTVSITQPNRVKMLSSSEVSNNSGSQFEEQILPVQDLFAQAFIELQKEIAEESARSYNRMAKSSDPLSIIEEGDERQKQRQRLLLMQKKRRQRLQTNKLRQQLKSNISKNTDNISQKSKNEDDNEGGYLKEIKLSPKLKKHEEQQRELITLQLEPQQLKKATSSTTSKRSNSSGGNNPYKRRKPSKKSYWDLSSQPSSLDLPHVSNRNTSISSVSNPTQNRMMSHLKCPNPKCGSSNITQLTNASGADSHAHTNEQAMTKGEIWGYKDRDNDSFAVKMRNCLDCGKVWREEDDL